MKVLWLSNSDDVAGTIPDHLRAYRLAAADVEEALGEPVEMIPRAIWPAADLPDIIDRWVDRFQPDLVVFHINGFWYLYPSVPLLLQRRLGRIGSYLARIGYRAADTPWFVRTRAYHWGRWLALKTIGGANYFTAVEVADTVETCVRRLVRHEEVGVVVRGQMFPRSWRWARLDAIRTVYRRTETLCRSLHVVHLAVDPDADDVERPAFWSSGDRLHTDADGHAFYARMDAEAMLRALQTARGETARAPGLAAPSAPAGG